LKKNYLAYCLLLFATLFWSGNFIVGKFATLFEIPPMSLNVLRWISVWIILIPLTYKEIYNNLAYIKKNIIIIGFMGVMTISTFNSVVYFALNYTQVINAVLVLAAIPAATIVLSSIMKIEKTNLFQILGLILSLFLKFFNLLSKIIFKTKLLIKSIIGKFIKTIVNIYITSNLF